MNNEIYLRRRRKIGLPVGEGATELPAEIVAALLKNIEPLGFTFSSVLIERLKTLSLAQVEAFYPEFIAALKKMVGAHQTWKPMYPNFPAQVMEMSEAQLYLNAILHYLTNTLPAYIKKERLPLFDKTEPKIIDLGSEAEFEEIFTNLVATKGSLSATDKEDVKWFVQNLRDEVARLLPTEIPARETLAYLGALLIQETSLAPEFLSRHVATATDVLRLAVALSSGDVSLAEKTKFVVFKRPTRRLLLELLEKAPNLVEDMLRWKGRWIRLGERLHPGEWSEKYPQAFQAFRTVRDDLPSNTFNSQVEAALEKGEVVGIVQLLQTRPGDFARRLDVVLRRDSAHQAATLQAFLAVAERVSTPVLLQLHAHFGHRLEGRELRTFFPKGDVAKVQAIENNLPSLSYEICLAVMNGVENALRARFAILEPLGACYLDERLKNYPLAFSQRSASKSLRTLPRGSRLPLPESKVVRFFLWWKNGKERTDLDLSAALFSSDFVYMDVISYYNLKNYGGHHSGDIVDAPEGAAEFIDLDIARLQEVGGRYVVMSVNSYTEQPYCDLPECFAGQMPRQAPDSGEIFEPRTVQDRMDLTANTEICLPLVIDVVKRELIWLDIALRHEPTWNNVDNNLGGISLMLRAMLTLAKPTLYDLFRLQIEARGQMVDSPELAQHVFSVEQGITPFDGEVIAAQWM